MKKLALTTLTLVSCIALSACNVTTDDSMSNARTSSYNEGGNTTTSSIFSNPFSDKTTNARIETAAKQAVADGNPEEALIFYERLYLKDAKLDNALNYAQVLRKTGNPSRATMVLAPFIEDIGLADTSSKKKKGKKGEYDPMLVLEYASATLETGKFERAESLLQTLLKEQKAAPLYPQIRNLIGVSMDARGQHKAAEPYYRDAMDTWEGRPITVMNNLALNLAHQGYFDEALSLLRQARVMSPQHTMIAENIKIVSSLQSAVLPKPKSLN